jgi:ribonuclease HI
MNNITHNPRVIIYTDGACQGNPGPGGWGAVLIFKEHKKKLSGYCPDTTNNKMELKGAIEALKSLKTSCTIDLYTDSQYVKKGMSEWIDGWIAKNWKSSTNAPVKNVELWKELHILSKMHQITWHWVKAHNGDINNEEADRLATTAITLKRTLMSHE